MLEIENYWTVLPFWKKKSYFYGFRRGKGKCLKQEYILLFKFIVEIKFTESNKIGPLVFAAKFCKWAVWDA